MSLSYSQERKRRLAQMRAGTHPQQSWRVTAITGARQMVHGAGARLGPLGPIPESIICEISLNNSFLRQLKSIGIKLTIAQLKGLVQSIIIQPTIDSILQKIDVWVPIKTGDLRNRLKDSLSQSAISNFPFKLTMDAKTIEYSKPVNNMPEKWLRTSGMSPQARKGWFKLLLLLGRNSAKKKYQTFLKQIASLLPRKVIKQHYPKRTNYNVARSLFKFTYR